MISHVSQVTDVALQLLFCHQVEAALLLHSSAASGGSSSLLTSSLAAIETSINEGLSALAAKVSSASSSSNDSAINNQHRLKIERIITLLVYQRDTVRLLRKEISSSSSSDLREHFAWLSVMRLYLSQEEEPQSSSSSSSSASSSSSPVVLCKMADACFDYSYEYLGVTERLVQTPLTDRAFLTLTQALHTKLGGAPAGPAGTGKTETVKALGHQLGRFVLVFNCERNFDFKSMERIFVGLCEVGAIGCFDEFNRLEERILSAVSQQIMMIQAGLRASSSSSSSSSSSHHHHHHHHRRTPATTTINFFDRTVRLHEHVGIFITMNPGYSGRSQLPDNLKQLFRSLSMAAPDRELIAEVMLFVRGFKHAEALSKKVVPLFKLCKEQLSDQPHYDFGLRALKSVLHAAGTLRRSSSSSSRKNDKTSAAAKLLSSSLQKEEDVNKTEEEDQEASIVLQALSETITPKLISSDVELFQPLLKDVFPRLFLLLDAVSNSDSDVHDDENKQQQGSTSNNSNNSDKMFLSQLHGAIDRHCQANHLLPDPQWVNKVVQLYKILSVHHGVMLVGASGTGKTQAWKALFQAMVDVAAASDNTINDDDNKPPTRTKKQIITVDIIDPKCIPKSVLFGSLDLVTREWKDGVFTSILRKLSEEFNTNQKQNQQQQEQPGKDDKEKEGAEEDEPRRQHQQEVEKQHFILLDGDVDPEWVENLNSLLDDNKILTLPTGERISLPPNVKIIFETSDLKNATLATVSRCGMVWFSADDVVPLSSCIHHLSRVAANVPTASTAAAQQSVVVSSGRKQQQQQQQSKLHLVFESSTSSSASTTSAASTITRSGSIKKQSSKNASSTSQHHSHHHPPSSSSSSLVFSRTLFDHLSSEFRPGGVVELCTNIITTVLRRQFSSEEQQKSTDNNKSSSPVVALADIEPPIMEWNPLQALRAVFSILFSSPASSASTSSVLLQHHHHPHHHCGVAVDAAYARRRLSLALAWGLTAGFSYSARRKIVSALPLPDAPPSSSSLFDYNLTNDGQWELWSKQLESSSSNNNSTAAPLVNYSSDTAVIPTVDTLRHEFILSSWIRSGGAAANESNNSSSMNAASCSSFMLCGPPGSGKTMSLTAVLNRHSDEYDTIFLNFSSATTPELVLKALEPVTIITKRSSSNSTILVMTPRSSSSTSNSSNSVGSSSVSENNNSISQRGVGGSSSSAATSNRKLIVFCDEINLPTPDQYGTQSVIYFIRQIVEHGGFYRPSDCAWITVDQSSIRFVGACNSPSDPGRYPLPHRFLRWAPVLFVDFPAPESLTTIYTAYCRSLLRRCTRVRAAAENLAKAMVAVYEASKTRFTPEMHKHYIYSPRELSRWVRSLGEAIFDAPSSATQQQHHETMSPEQLIRLAIHEGLRIFKDRLVTAEERKWTDATMDDAFAAAFGTLPKSVTQRPMLYSTLFSRQYASCDMEKVRRFLQEKLRLFGEEEYDAQLVVFDAVCEHVLRIDRVLRQPHGHMLLVGASGVGKTSLSKFAAWLNNICVFQVKTHRGYTLEHFQQDLRAVMRRAGCDREKICFIFDESNVLDSGFLEFMNALLASGDVPGLFEGEERMKLLQQIRESVKTAAAAAASASSSSSSSQQPQPQPQSQSQQQQKNDNDTSSSKYVDLNSDTDCYSWFVANVTRNLHVIFTMNPDNGDFSSRAATSPALFNRCVVDWFGDWDAATMVHVASELTAKVPIAVAPPTKNGGDGGEEDVDDAMMMDREEMLRGFVATSIYKVHEGVSSICDNLRKRSTTTTSAAANNNGNSSSQPITTTAATTFTSYITPRHFIDVIHHFKALYKEKRDELVQLQRHLSAGLSKLAKTSTAVDRQMTELKGKEIVLAKTSEEAQKMLDRIVGETQLAEKAKKEATHLAEVLAEEEKQMATQKADAEQQLSSAQPALEAAASALSTIKPENLREIRAYSKPPVMVRLVLEAVVVVLGESTAGGAGPGWDTVKNYIRRDDFIALVRAFQPSDVSASAQDFVKKNYLSDPKFTAEEAVKASRAAGPLVQWVQAQVRYAEINVNIKPLRESISRLGKQCAEQQVLLERTKGEVVEYDKALSKLKEEYQGTLQRQTAIKADIDSVEKRCARANSLVGKLRAEKDRWELDAGGLRAQVTNQLGDCLVCASFLSYAGSLEEKVRRQAFFPLLQRVLEDADISCSSSSGIISSGSGDQQQHQITTAATTTTSNNNLFNIIEYLSKPAVRASWHAHGLPQDDLCVENAIILSRTRRYAFIIDPSGQASEFVSSGAVFASSSSKQQASSAPTTTTTTTTTQTTTQTTTTSFSEKNLLKAIEMSVRFGTPLVIHDAEHIDPVLNPLLNREWRKSGGGSGGRVMMKLASLDIDVSPAFNMVLCTRDAFTHFSPDLCGRVSMVNFTTTQSSLSSQFLHTLLKHENPQVARVRADLMMTRADKTFKLRGLEEQLLDAIAAAESDILENDTLLQSLETLKSESATITEQMSSLEAQLDTVRQVELTYENVAQCIAKTHFALAEMAVLHPMYRFSLSVVTKTLLETLSSSSSRRMMKTSSPSPSFSSSRQKSILRRFFGSLHTTVQRGLFEQDRLAFQLRLAQLRSDEMMTISTTTTTTASSNSSNNNIIPSKLWDILLGHVVLTTTTKMNDNSTSDTPPKKISSNKKYPALPPSKFSQVISPSQWDQLTSLASTAIVNDEVVATSIFAPIVDSFLVGDNGARVWDNFFGLMPTTENGDEEEDENDDDLLSTIPPQVVTHLQRSPRFQHPALIACVNLCLIKILRPENVPSAVETFVTAVFDVFDDDGDGDDEGEEQQQDESKNNNNGASSSSSSSPSTSFLSQHGVFDLEAFVDTLDAFTPALIVSFAGYDPSPRIEQLFNNNNNNKSPTTSTSSLLLSVAMGSPESLKIAQAHLDDGMRHGKWVLLLNVHFCPELLASIEKQLHYEKQQLSSSNSSGKNRNTSSGGGTDSLHTSFRLFLVCEQSPAIPPSLCKISRMFVFEAPKGLRANMRRALAMLIRKDSNSKSVSSSSSSHHHHPVELARVLFVAAWIHSVITERLRYLPVGWSKKYEFSDSDFQRSVATLTSWIDRKAQNREHIEPSEIPWAMLRRLIGTAIYGGRIDSEFDTKLLDSMLEWCLSPRMFDSDFSLAVGPEINCEGGVTLDDFAEWVENSEDFNTTTTSSTSSGDTNNASGSGGDSNNNAEPPEWLGLPSWATQLALRQRGRETLQRWAMIQQSQQGGTSKMATSASSSSATGVIDTERQQQQQQQRHADPTTATTILVVPVLFEQMQPSIRTWLQTTSSAVSGCDEVCSLVCQQKRGTSTTNNNNCDPLTMCLARESRVANDTLKRIKKQLSCLSDACAGNIHFTNSLRTLGHSLHRGVVPQEWKSALASSSSSSDFTSWLSVVASKIDAQLAWLQRAAETATSHPHRHVLLSTPTPLGSLFFPGPFLTAARQLYARNNSAAIEQTRFTLQLAPAAATTTAAAAAAAAAQSEQQQNADRMNIVGLHLQGATVDDNGTLMMPVRESVSSVPVRATLVWSIISHSSSNTNDTNHSSSVPLVVTVPVYATEQRVDLLFSAEVPVDADVFDAVWLQRRVCLIARAPAR